MKPLSPTDPEIESLWQAISASGARSVAVVSSHPDEGTALVARALAQRAALTNRPSLVVDLDQTRADVAHLMGLSPSPGEIMPVTELGLGVLAAPMEQEARIWREPQRLAAQVALWGEDWGLVVFNTAPLLSRDEGTVPGMAVAAAADATVLVTLAGRTPAAAIREAKARLDTAAANLIGVVMNDSHNLPAKARREQRARRLPSLMPRLRLAVPPVGRLARPAGRALLRAAVLVVHIPAASLHAARTLRHRLHRGTQSVGA